MNQPAARQTLDGEIPCAVPEGLAVIMAVNAGLTPGAATVPPFGPCQYILESVRELQMPERRTARN
jgi:hypothetical protein